ncbi:hypothetical protein LX36DRAFT_60410 [Colletotrichum falcatum]|nr:hypothetical protein LX36DRAFT_60410 [Colletotrichum falcatum]
MKTGATLLLLLPLALRLSGVYSFENITQVDVLHHVTKGLPGRNIAIPHDRRNAYVCVSGKDRTTTGPADPPIDFIQQAREQNALRCFIYQDHIHREAEKRQCENTCRKQLEQARKEGRTSSPICVGF